MKEKRLLIILLIIVAIVISGIVGTVLLINGFGKKPEDSSPKNITDKYASSQQIESKGQDEEVYEDYIDAEEYFEENGELLGMLSVLDSDMILSEEQVADYLTDKGFEETEIFCDEDMEGNYIEAKISRDHEKHPTYRTSYVSETGEYWTIQYINGQLTAYPVYYNLQRAEEEKVPVILSESETIMSYDSVTNTYFETIPKESVLKVIVVENIDASGLESVDIASVSE